MLPGVNPVRTLENEMPNLYPFDGTGLITTSAELESDAAIVFAPLASKEIRENPPLAEFEAEAAIIISIAVLTFSVTDVLVVREVYDDEVVDSYVSV